MNPQNPNRPNKPYRSLYNSYNANDKRRPPDHDRPYVSRYDRENRQGIGTDRNNNNNRYNQDDRPRYNNNNNTDRTRAPKPKPSNALNGLIIVNKPIGPTSHDIVYRVRKWSNERRVGHTGTLDPLASGVLIICLGPATRIAEYLLHSDKTYRAIIRLGETTDTYDSQGTITDTAEVNLTQEQIEAALANFRGKITQTPPAYSAVQVNGKRAYEAAREGEPLDLAPREVTIYSLNLISWKSPDLVLDVSCSAGTYIRSLANDIGQTLNTGGHITSLMRTATGAFTLADAHALNDLENIFRAGKGNSVVVETDKALQHWAEVRLDAEGAKRIMHGNPTPMTGEGSGYGRAYDPQGRLVAIVEADPATHEWKPRKVLITADDSRPYTGANSANQ